MVHHDEDITTSSHTSQGEEEVQHGRPIHLFHGGSPVRLKFDTPRKMKVDDNPFPRDQNMVDVRIFKEKTKVLTSAKSRKDGTVDPKMQILTDEYR